MKDDKILEWFENGVNRYGNGDKENVLRRWRGLDHETLEYQIEGSVKFLSTDRKTFERGFKKFFGVPLSSITDFAPENNP
jgi:hypothetical protein